MSKGDSIENSAVLCCEGQESLQLTELERQKIVSVGYGNTNTAFALARASTAFTLTGMCCTTVLRLHCTPCALCLHTIYNPRNPLCAVWYSRKTDPETGDTKISVGPGENMDCERQNKCLVVAVCMLDTCVSCSPSALSRMLHQREAMLMQLLRDAPRLLPL
jgi:hypothetical protein